MSDEKINKVEEILQKLRDLRDAVEKPEENEESEFSEVTIISKLQDIGVAREKTERILKYVIKMSAANPSLDFIAHIRAHLEDIYAVLDK